MNRMLLPWSLLRLIKLATGGARGSRRSAALPAGPAPLRPGTASAPTRWAA